MGVDSDIVGNSGTPHSLEWNGDTYQFRLIDQDMQATFEKHLFERDKKTLELMKELYPIKAYVERLNALGDDYTIGLYGMMSPKGLAYAGTMAGMIYLASLITGCETKKLFGLFQNKKEEAQALFQLVLRESFPGIDWEAIESAKKKAEAEGKQMSDLQAALAAPLTKKELLGDDVDPK